MNNAEYYGQIHKIRTLIDELDEAYWSAETFTPEGDAEYNKKRQELVDQLETAFAAK